jgi:uncharacterized small protein (TIGR04563 family)
MIGNDRRKQSLYFTDSMLEEIKSEAARMDRSLSWVVQKAWKLARNQVRAMPSANDPVGPDPRSGPNNGAPC